LIGSVKPKSVQYLGYCVSYDAIKYRGCISLASVVPESEFIKIHIKVLHRNLVVLTNDTALNDSPERFDCVCVYFAVSVLKAVIDGVVLKDL